MRSSSQASSHFLYDSGLQIERTLLAWRRTSLSVACGGAVLLRFSFDTVGAPGLIASAVCFGSATVSGLAANRRYRRASERLLSRDVAADAGAVATLLAGSVVGLALVIFIIASTLLIGPNAPAPELP